MSMSSLSAQLAALNSSSAGGKNVGSSLSTSRRHEDAIGRGIGHSVKHGHALHTASPHFKPSVLYADAKEASDVPLTTLRENCVSSLRQIAKVTENQAFVEPQYLQTLAGVHSLNFERGLATRAENERVDDIIGSLLSLLSTVLGETASSACFTSCLHILEFLLRRYDIHARPTTAERLLVATLPHHEQPLFSRVLQLVDLASLPTWTFLRPHAAVGAPTVSRLVLAKRASKDTVLLKYCCQLAQNASKIHAAECEGHLMESPRRGISRVVSFAAAVIVEALTLQARNTGSISEPSLRCLLPFLLSACGDGGKAGPSLACVCPDWRGWGLVVTSCVAERCLLASNVRETTATALAKGALETFQILESIESNDEAGDEQQSSGKVERTADALVVLMSVLMQSDEDKESMLAKVVNKRKNKNAGHDRIGLSLPTGTYRALLKLPCLAVCLGHLYEDRDIDISPFVASLFARGLLRLAKELEKNNSESRSLKLLLDMIHEPNLSVLWRDRSIQLTAAAASAIVKSCAAGAMDEPLLEAERSVLDALRVVDTEGSDAGVANAVTSIFGKKRSVSTKQQVTSLLGLAENMQDSSVASEASDIVTSGDSSARYLPPLVALEHAEPSIRFEAIRRLTSSSPEAAGGISQLVDTYLRHLCIEEDTDVAMAVGRALLQLLQTASAPLSHDAARMTLAALSKWTILGPGGTPKQADDSSSESDLNVLELLLDASGYVSGLVDKTRSSLEFRDDTSFRLLQAIIAHLDFPIDQPGLDTIAKSACSALNRCLGAHTSQRARETVASAKKLLVSHRYLRRIHRENIEKKLVSAGTSGDVIRCAYLWVYLQTLTEVVDKSTSKAKHSDLEDCILDAFATSLALLGSKQDATTIESKEDVKCIIECQEICAKRVKTVSLERFSNLLISLASIEPTPLFELGGAPAISAFCAELGSDSSWDIVAILLETALRDELPEEVVIRLVNAASTPVVVISEENLSRTVALALALLGHTDQGVRESSLSFLSRVSEILDGERGDACSPATEICMLATSDETKASIRMGGTSSLAALLAGGVRGSREPEKLRTFVLQQCVVASTGSEVLSSLRERPGAWRSSIVLLNALEKAGDQTWPLAQRWEQAGKRLFSAFLEAKGEKDGSHEAGVLGDLITTVARMLKGVKVDDTSSLPEESNNVVISTGPNTTGTRARSYSVGRVPGTSFVDPYPDEMCDAIIDCMSAPLETKAIALELCRCLIRDVVGSPSWSEVIFPHLKTSSRRSIAAGLLELRENIGVTMAGEALLGLIFDASDIAFLFGDQTVEEDVLGRLVVLADYARTNSDRLKADSNLSGLVTKLFDILRNLSEVEDLSDSGDFARHSILLALVDLTNKATEEGPKKKKKKLFTKKDLGIQVEFLARLLRDSGDAEKKAARPLASWKSRSAALSLLTGLCSVHPEAVVSSLVSALLVSAVGSHAGSSTTPARDAIFTVVPVFRQHAETAEVSMFDLFIPFIGKISKITKRQAQLELCAHMVDALGKIPKVDGGRTDLVGDFICAFLSKGKVVDLEKEPEPEKATIVASIVQHNAIPTQLTCILQILAHANTMFLLLKGQNQDDEIRSTSMDSNAETLERMLGMEEGAEDSINNRREALKSSAVDLLRLVLTCLSEGPLRAFVKRGIEPELSLRLWQDLLVVQATLLDENGSESLSEDRSFWELYRNIAKDCLAEAQGLLPTHLFVASASSLLRDSSDADLQTRALRFIADRASEIDTDSPEVSIFLDLVPILADTLDSLGEKSAVESNSFLKQSLLLTAENIARVLCLTVGPRQDNSFLGVFSPLLDRAVKILAECSDLLIGTKQTPKETISQMTSSAALCTSTLIRVLKVQALPVLPKLMNGLQRTLLYANKVVVEDPGDTTSQPDLLQLSVLRALASVVDCLPQFVSPYLEMLLDPSFFPSDALRRGGSDGENAVKSATNNLEVMISSKIPARQLIPAACNAMDKCSGGSKEKFALLSMVQLSIGSSTKNEVSTVRSRVVKAITDAYDHNVGAEGGFELLQLGNRVLMTMILKMSETQLRPLYASLREWSREDSQDESILSKRKYAFWSLSSGLSKELRMIFLPHFGTVAIDAVNDLNLAASKLSGQSRSVKLSQGKKRRRVGESEETETAVGEDSEALLYLPSLLQCLEHVFKADAHEGGAWIRADDGQRYSSLLEPLTKLLQSHVPSDFLPASRTSSLSCTSYEWLIQGDENDEGCVIGCLTALATAAGNEQLWKPLNFGVLEACGNEHRSEVRKAGVKCLLSLIKALGEEYMVLLPECLPVLSELLEDGDEEISGLSQECVTLGEELLGESLQESLR